MPCLCEKRLRGEHVGPIGKRAGDSRMSWAKKKTKVQQSKEEPTTREDLLLLWEARRGSSTALVGLGRGKEALAKATGATELADQLAEAAMQAECEGLCGRAWQSVAAKNRREIKYRHASTAFEALYGQPEDGNDEHEDDTDGEECSSEEKSQHNRPIDGSSGLQGRKKRGITPATGAESDPDDAKASAREAAGCFRRQVALLKSLNRFSTPLPHLEVELNFNIGDDGLPICPTKTPDANKCKEKQRIEQNAHLAALQALLELGKTALSLGEVDSAVEVFKRRLKLAESRCDWPSRPSGQDDESSVLQMGVGPPISSHPAKNGVPLPPDVSFQFSSTDVCHQPMGACGQHKNASRAAAPSTEAMQPKETCVRRGSSKNCELETKEGSALDVAEALWWVAISTCQQHLGVDLTSSPRFQPFIARPRLPPTSTRLGIGMGAGSERLPEAAPRRKGMVSSEARMMASSRSESSRKGNEGIPMDVRPRTTFLCGGGSTNSLIDHDRVVFTPALPPTPCRVRAHCRQPTAYPRAYRKHGKYNLPRSARRRRPSPRNTARSAPRWDTREVDGGREAEATPSLRQDREPCGTDVAALVANFPAEEATDEMMKGSLLWRESGVGRVTELTAEGVLHGMGETCRPVTEYLRRQLAIAMSCDLSEESSLQKPPRTQVVTRDALMGLGTMATLCGDDGRGCDLYERAAQCCRASGDWTGLAHALAAKSRLQAAAGRFEEAVGGFKLGLKLARELRDDVLAASAHSCLGWAMASRGGVKEALDHFRQWRKISCRSLESSSAAASELCIAHMHVRLAIALSGDDGDQTVCHDTPQTDPNPALELSSHAELVGARRHYSRYLRWAKRVDDACGVSHAHTCLARMYQVMEDDESSAFHRHASLEGHRWREDTDIHGKMRAKEHEGVVRDMLQLN
ncbi:unnamed protein product [Ectocarpus fasciculatus]